MGGGIYGEKAFIRAFLNHFLCYVVDISVDVTSQGWVC